jgi:hypothetical protein
MVISSKSIKNLVDEEKYFDGIAINMYGFSSLPLFTLCFCTFSWTLIFIEIE